MRCFLYILIAVWLGAVAPVAEASDVLLGVVVSVDRGQGRITLKVIDSSGPGEGQSLVIAASPEKIPGSLSPGDTIRVWGDYASNGGAAFRADAIRKGGSGDSGTDPTGVRSRLGKGGQGSGQGTGGKGSGRR
jgi:hypothetical protein